MPSERVESEIKMFYNRTNLQIKFDNRFNRFEPNGHGEITYFTVKTPNVVLVSIRGTQLGYDWLIDFDIWTESVISQIMSVIFPWSRLYPHYLKIFIAKRMSITPRRSIFRSQHTELTKRYYVTQMINKLKEISKEYPEPRSLIIVGHSLGGGLAKLAGIGLNRTKLIVSISGPGITYSHRKYNETRYVTTESLDARIFNILHDRDIVPWADKQEGLIQMITCPKQYSRIQCHAILPMFCNMLQNCGNPRKFAINKDICQP
jgi:putative lipase involved disintegration of autophagic bodies